jgi:Family of unknown function (DUF5670)
LIALPSISDAGIIPHPEANDEFDETHSLYKCNHLSRMRDHTDAPPAHTAYSHNSERRKIMLWVIIIGLLVLWLAGFVLDVAGGLIHLLLVVAAIVFIFNLFGGRKSAA